VTTTAPLLIELLTEELPPKSLARLSTAFGEALAAGLGAGGFLTDAGAAPELFATPRRLAARFGAVRAEQDARRVTRKGPAVASGLDASGKPTPALAGFARSCGVDVSAPTRVRDAKAEYFAHESVKPGEPLDRHLAGIVADALRKLPIAKLMRWGSGEAQFVRPVHGLVMLLGDRVVPGEVLGIVSGNTTRGHRFQGKASLVIDRAAEYESRLETEGRVIASFAVRRAEIERRLVEAAARLGASLADPQSLLDEVTALVERPAVYAGGFDPEFLEVPQECLILTMRQNQKYFPLLDAAGRLMPKFLIVSNMRLDDPGNVVGGNERVVRPRLADARFFFEQDRRQPLESRLPELARMVYHNKLGSQHDRVERLRALGARLAAILGVDARTVDRAALLCKADLATAMVGEFPELQGVMGRYYATHDGEPAEVGAAIEQHYRPRFAADRLPDAGAPAVLAAADKLDILTGIFGIGLAPSGDRDPFALRRHALGLIRIIIEHDLPLKLYDLVATARRGFGKVGLADSVENDVVGFVLDRAIGYFREQGYIPEEVESVLDLYRAHDLPANQLGPRLAALKRFRALPEAASLIEANKRSRNILVKENAASGSHRLAPDALVEPSERSLYEAIAELAPAVEAKVAAGDFAAALEALAGLRDGVDRFFTEVRVVVPEERIRANRFALLSELNALLNRVANLSRLPA